MVGWTLGLMVTLAVDIRDYTDLTYLMSCLYDTKYREFDGH